MTSTQPAAHHPSPLDDRLSVLRNLFPEAVRDGELDPDVLAELIDPDRVRDSRFGLVWHGRGAAIRALAAQPEGALHLRDATPGVGGHDVIGADNLEAMKLLRTAYSGRVKMCFIDPPYNTGRDFVYRDNFSDPRSAYLSATGQLDDDGLRTDTESELRGRKHSSWLTMMYPRLVLAQELLAEDGVIFVTIDAIEAAHLRVLMDEVFTEEAFVAAIAWQRRAGSPNDKVLGPVHDTILVYAKGAVDPKNPDTSSLYRLTDMPRIRAKYTNPDNHPLGDYVPDNLSANGDGGRYVASCDFPITNPVTGKVYNPPAGGCWRLNSETVERYIAEKRIDFGPDGTGGPRLRRFWTERADGVAVPDLWDDLGPAVRKEMASLVTALRKSAEQQLATALPAGLPAAVKRAAARAVKDSVKFDEAAFNSTRLADPWHAVGNNKSASAQLARILTGQEPEQTDDDIDETEDEGSSGTPFQTPKPLSLVETCLRMGTKADKGHLVLDFFAGSGTTAAAVMRLNAADGGDRRSISIQLPEPTDHSGYDDLFDVTVRRIRAEATALGCEAPVRVWRYADPVFTPWRPAVTLTDPDEVLALFEADANRIPADADLDTVARELALTAGLPLDSAVEHVACEGATVAVVSDPRSPARIHVTLDTVLSGRLAESLGLAQSDYLYCRDAALTDTTKANLSLRCHVRTL